MKGIFWLVLTPLSRNTLLQVVKPRFPKVYAHHVTLYYNIELSPDQKMLLGKTIVIEAALQAWNESIQAVPVTIPLSTQNKVPHVTISSLPETPPVASNKMLEGNYDQELLPSPLTLEATIQFKQL